MLDLEGNLKKDSKFFALKNKNKIKYEHFLIKLWHLIHIFNSCIIHKIDNKYEINEIFK